MRHEPRNFNSPSEQSPPSSRHRCYICSRTYERHDHLNRHLKSHDNERSYRCSECGRGFNRADLLNRHRAAHVRSAGDALRRRTTWACEACIKAKSRCDEERPCNRCRTRSIPCQDTEGRRMTLPDQQTLEASSIMCDDPLLPEQDASPQTFDVDDGQMVQQAPFENVDLPHQRGYGETSYQGLQQRTPESTSRQYGETSSLLGLNSSIFNSDSATPIEDGPDSCKPQNGNELDYGLTEFFEHIMIPETNLGVPTNMTLPPDVSNFTQDLTCDAVDFDFNCLASGLTRPPSAQGDKTSPSNSRAHVTETSESITQLRSEAFKRSPWSWNNWVPERNWHAFSGQDEINVEGDKVDANDRLVTPVNRCAMRRKLNVAVRDRMIRVIAQVADQRLSIPSFPSLKLLEDLVDIFLLQGSSSADSYVHAASFNCDVAHIELVLGMVASGATYIALSPVWRMGLVLQEVVRLALSNIFETDNSTTRDLQLLQAFMLWIDIGAFSGFRRKTEIALSFLQPLTTMLTWSDALKRNRYEDISPHPDEPHDILIQKWESWADQEALKRLVVHAFVHDSQVSITNMKNTILSATQMQLPLPAAKELWLAPDALAWKSAYLRLKPLQESETPSMAHLFGNFHALDGLDAVDKHLCLLAVCHALGREVWAYRQSARLLSNWKIQHHRDRWLANQTIQRDLENEISRVQTYCEAQSGQSVDILLTLELLIMTLHVDLEDIQTFSGKFGEDEARKAFPHTRNWVQEVESRTAVWHAAQVVRLARNFEKTRLRDFYAIAFYHAVLTLWVYGIVTSSLARQSGRETPVQAAPHIADQHNITHAPSIGEHILLDSVDKTAGNAFILLGHGTPGIESLLSTFVPLTSPGSVMSAAEMILKHNFPCTRNGLPPLVKNLANLMAELGNLSRKG